MRKRSFFTGFVLVLFIELFLTGCASVFVFDKSIPEENLSIIKIPNELTVVKFDDKKVNWKTSFSNLSLDPRALKATAKIPAGEHTLIVNYYSVLDYGTHKKIKRIVGVHGHTTEWYKCFMYR